jgi:hypothetical protein
MTSGVVERPGGWVRIVPLFEPQYQTRVLVEKPVNTLFVPQFHVTTEEKPPKFISLLLQDTPVRGYVWLSLGPKQS